MSKWGKIIREVEKPYRNAKARPPGAVTPEEKKPEESKEKK